MTAVVIPVVLSRRRLDKLHAARLRVGLAQIDDSTLMHYLVHAGYDFEIDALERLGNGFHAPRSGSLPENVERDLGGVIKD